MGALLRNLANGTEWRLDAGDEWTLGRGADSDLRVADPSTARHHARIRFAEGAWRLSDLSGSTGTRLNGARIEREEEVRSGDAIAFGATLLWFETGGAPPSLSPSRPRREAIALPQTFEALLTLFRAKPLEVDGALICARAGEALLRFADIPERQSALAAAYKDALASEWPVIRAISAHGMAAMSVVAARQGSKGLAPLEPLLEHSEEYVRDAALAALSTLDPLAAAPRLHALALQSLSPGAGAHHAARRAAEVVRTGDDTLIASLVHRAIALAFDSRETEPRLIAAAVLGELAAGGDLESLRCLATMLARADAGEHERLAIVAALRRAGRPEGRTTLLSALQDDAPAVFHAAARALSDARDPRLVDRLKADLTATPTDAIERRARYRRALEDVTGERRGPDPAAWLA